MRAIGVATDSSMSNPILISMEIQLPDGLGPRTGNFPGGLFDYSKTFDVPEGYRDRSVTIEFEGVYRDAMVFINGEFAAQRPNGYTNFYVKADPYLRHGEANTIRVQARAHPGCSVKRKAARSPNAGSIQDGGPGG